MNQIKIRKTREEDIPEVLNIYDSARKYMRATGNMSQWPEGYPGEESLLKDISLGESYVCYVNVKSKEDREDSVKEGKEGKEVEVEEVHDGERIVGTFFFHTGLEPTYAQIHQGQWLNDHPYGVIHRAASDGTWRGVMRAILDYCFQMVGDIRIDTHRDNTPMQKALKDNGFSYCGIIYLTDGDERLAFQRSNE